MAITPAKAHHLPYKTYGITCALVLVNLPNGVHKKCRTHQHSYTIKCWKIFKITIFLRPEEARFEIWQKLVL